MVQVAKSQCPRPIELPGSQMNLPSIEALRPKHRQTTIASDWYRSILCRRRKREQVDTITYAIDALQSLASRICILQGAVVHAEGNIVNTNDISVLDEADTLMIAAAVAATKATATVFVVFKEPSSAAVVHGVSCSKLPLSGYSLYTRTGRIAWRACNYGRDACVCGTP
jgi:hypothetical protein